MTFHPSTIPDRLRHFFQFVAPRPPRVESATAPSSTHGDGATHAAPTGTLAPLLSGRTGEGSAGAADLVGSTPTPSPADLADVLWRSGLAVPDQRPKPCKTWGPPEVVTVHVDVSARRYSADQLYREAVVACRLRNHERGNR